MRKFIALFVLLIQLFNIAGNLVLHQYLKFKSEQFSNAQAAKGLYKISDLEEVKLTVHTAMYADWQEYEDISGTVQFAGATYNYVKMKMTREAIYIMCVPNYDGTQLTDGNTITAKDVDDVHIPKKDHVPPFKFVVQVNTAVPLTQIAFEAPIKQLPLPVLQREQELVYQHLDIPEQPPRLAC